MYGEHVSRRTASASTDPFCDRSSGQLSGAGARDGFKLPLDESEDVYSRTCQLALAAALEALADAGWNAETLRGKRVGVAVGTTVGCALNCDDFYRDYKGRVSRTSESCNDFYGAILRQ